MGVAAIFPVGSHYVIEGEKFDLSSGIAQNAFEELKGRGLLNPQFWHYADPQFDLSAATTTVDNPPIEYDTLVMPTAANPNPGEFSIEDPFGPGHAFVIDPMGTAADPTLNFLYMFPRFTDNSGALVAGTGNPWRSVLSGRGWPVRRITVLDANGLMSKPVAETIFRLRDDLVVEQPEKSDVPSIQRWDLADLNNTPNDPSDDTPLRRQYKGNYSWLATIVPVTEAGRDALQPASPDFGEIRYDVSVVVFRKRDDTPAAASERLIDAELLPGGELVIFSSDNTLQGKDEVDAAVDGIRSGNWISLMGVNQATGDFVMKWYRLLAMDEETIQIPVVTTSSMRYGRRAMLIGPDWPASGLVSNSTGTALINLRAGIYPDTVSVTTKPLKMESTSLWKLQ
jgi:hypothetical protein